eukprot:CAMPEP_0174714590 /NCGR_PEP_ID=MMETSP1094-20130205/18606_1 /TAXON_ID=156173 /ORGANISM="Chrysochromulina brevifilum, Strain UTEX LB 985" /LENGTH=171 /DNA_ID=CAMNT_0015913975 /DNA_START=376 /DNA_END=891 /DNA_ORIENTATION=+
MKSSGEYRSRKRGWRPVPWQLSQTITPRPSQFWQMFSVALIGYLSRISLKATTCFGPESQSSTSTVLADPSSPVISRTPATYEANWSVPDPLQMVQLTTFSDLHTTQGCAFSASSFRLPAFSVKAIRPTPPPTPSRAAPTPTTVLMSMSMSGVEVRDDMADAFEAAGTTKP